MQAQVNSERRVKRARACPGPDPGASPRGESEARLCKCYAGSSRRSSSRCPFGRRLNSALHALIGGATERCQTDMLAFLTLAGRCSLRSSSPPLRGCPLATAAGLHGRASESVCSLRQQSGGDLLITSTCTGSTTTAEPTHRLTCIGEQVGDIGSRRRFTRSSRRLPASVSCGGVVFHRLD